MIGTHCLLHKSDEIIHRDKQSTYTEETFKCQPSLQKCWWQPDKNKDYDVVHILVDYEDVVHIQNRYDRAVRNDAIT